MNHEIIFGLGMHKCGTTWLQNCLYAHPEINVPLRGTEYYSDDQLYKKPFEWYLEQFKNSKFQCNIDFCNDYGIHYQKALPRIKKHHPESKFFIILRNPYERAISHLVQDIKQGLIPKDAVFSEYLSVDSKYVLRGQYKDLIEEFQKYFSESQLFVLFMDDIEQNATQMLSKLYGFLGVDPSFIPESIHKKVNVARSPRSLKVEKYQNEIYRLLKTNSWGDKLWWLSKKIGAGSFIRKINTSSKDQYHLPNVKDKQLILGYFGDDIDFVKKYSRRNDLKWHT